MTSVDYPGPAYTEKFSPFLNKTASPTPFHNLEKHINAITEDNKRFSQLNMVLCDLINKLGSAVSDDPNKRPGIDTNSSLIGLLGDERVEFNNNVNRLGELINNLREIILDEGKLNASTNTTQFAGSQNWKETSQHIQR